MANIPVNSTGIVLSGSGAITGSFGGFTVAQAVTFTGLRDFSNSNLATGVNTLTFGTGVTVPLYITSASISAGAIILYP